MYPDLVTSGCLRGVLDGKAYSKSLFCLKTVCEAMERLFLERFMEEEKDLTITDPVALLILVQSCDCEKLDTAIKDPMTLNVIQYENKVRTGHLRKTAVYWPSFIDHARLIFMLLYCVKVNNFKLLHKCNSEMANLFFAYGGQNYAR